MKKILAITLVLILSLTASAFAATTIKVGATPAPHAEILEICKEILKEQAKVAAKYSFDTIATDNETATATLQEAGVTFNFEPDVQSFKDALGGTEYYNRYANESWFSQELLDAILAK